MYLSIIYILHITVYWTGAEPAEYESGRKRPEYSKYQEQVPILIPIHKTVNFIFDSHQIAGWPRSNNKIE